MKQKVEAKTTIQFPQNLDPMLKYLSKRAKKYYRIEVSKSSKNKKYLRSLSDLEETTITKS